MQVLIRQAKIADPRSDLHGKVVDIFIEDGKIKDIAATLKIKAKQIIEAKGLMVSPGFVDAFADYCEPGFEQKEAISTGLQAAAAGGFTQVLLAPNTNPVVSTKSVVEFVSQKANGNIVKLHPLGAITQDIEGKSLSEMMDMHAHGAIAFTDGWKPVQNANLMLKALEYVKAFNGVAIQLPVDAALSADGLMHEGVASTKLGMAGIPTLAETIMIHRDIELLRYTGSRLHISGVSTAEGLDMIKKAKKEGLDITCSVTPYHLALTDEALSNYSSLYKVSPPLRSEKDRKALVDGLKDGTVDCIVSHHRPQEWDAKAKEFEYASEGMNVQEIAFSIVWNSVSKKVGIERLIEAMSVKPREIFGLGETKIAKGSIADVTLFTTSGDTTVEGNKLKSKSRNNPFIGNSLQGKVLGVINNNKVYLNQ
jgi:dihydroorotase